MEYSMENIRLFRQLAPSAVAAYEVLGDSAKMLAFSDRLPALLGFSREEYETRGQGDVIQLIVPQDRKYIKESIVTAIREHRDASCSYRAILSEGRYHWMNIRGHYVGDSSGHSVFLAEFFDTTQETKIHESLLDASSSGIYVCDIKTRELFYSNQHALDFWDRGDDFFGRTCYDFFRGRKDVCPWCVCGSLADQPIHIESTDDPDHEGFLKITCQKLDWYGRESYCIIFDDISGERRAQEETRNIIERIPAAILVYRDKDNEIEIIQANGALAEVAGVSRTSILERGNDDQIIEHVHPEDVATVQQGIQRLFSHERETEFVYRDRPDVESPYRWLHYRGRSYPQFDGTQLAYAVVTDVTESMETKRNNDEIVDMVANLPVNSLLLHFFEGGKVRPVSFSDEFCHMLGVTQKEAWELYGQDALASTHPDDRQLLAEYAMDCIHKHDTQMKSLTHRFIRPDGTVVWVIANFSFFQVDFKDYGYMVYTDISEVKAEESELKRRFSEEQGYLDSVADDYLDTARVNLTHNRIETLSGTSMLAKHSVEELTYDGFLLKYVEPELVRDSDRELLRRCFLRQSLLQAFKDGERTLSAEGQFRPTLDANQVWARVTVNLMQNPESGDVVAFMVMEDIDSEKIDQQIFERMMSSDECDYVAIIDVKRRTIDFRRVAESATTKPITEITDYDKAVEATLKMYIAETDREETRKAVSIETIVGHLVGEAVYTCAISLIGRHGGFHRKLLRYSYLDRDEGKVLAIRSDITEAYHKEQAATERLQKALRDAETANAAKSDFLSRMSHDIRTPLNGITGMTRIAREYERLPQIDDCLDKIDTSSSFLLGLVNDVLDMSKAESGKMELHPEPYLMSEFNDYLESVIKPLCDEKNQTLHMSTTPVENAIPIVDILRFNQIMFNLLSNAVKFTPEGGTISLEVRNDLIANHKEHIVAVIRDNGTGMSDEFQKVLFDPFSQENRNDISESRGTGLGLTIVKRLVDIMGGSIDVQSTLGQGTTFTVCIDFDYVEAEQATWKQREQEESKDYGRLSGKHVLLCEDHPLNQEIAVHLLEKQGMIVTAADDGHKGLGAFRGTSVGYYDAILMDIRMPQMDGFEATRAIRALNRKDAETVPIIAMTADAYEDDVRRCLEVGMDAHVPKPVDPATLYDVLSSWIGRSHSEGDWRDRPLGM